MSVSNVFSPTPVRSLLKRSLAEDIDPELEPASKRCRSESPVLYWLSNVSSLPRSQSVLADFGSHKNSQSTCNRPQSMPAKFDNNRFPPTLKGLVGEPKSPGPIDEMGDYRDVYRRDKNRGDDSFSQSTKNTTLTKIKPSSTKYKSVLEYNGVYIDRTGNKMSDAVRGMVNTDILKKRTSPPLPPELLNHTVTSMDQWGNSTENVVNNFVTSSMFPVHQPGVALGGNSLWPRAALPYDPNYGYPISTPKPDYHVGYAVGKQSGFLPQQAHVIDHSYAQKYTQPGTGNSMPYLTVELKSEATGGTLWHAENQAAGSGTYCVKAMEWLLEQAKASENATEIDTVAFSIAATGRLVVLSIHWRSLEDRAYYMSYVKSFVTTDKEHVQACHSTVKNVLDWAVGERHRNLKQTLQILFPLSDQWTQKQTAAAAELDEEENGEAGEEEEEEDEEEPSTPAASFSRRSGGKRRAEPVRRSSATMESFASTQSLGTRRTAVTRDTVRKSVPVRNVQQGLTRTEVPVKILKTGQKSCFSFYLRCNCGLPISCDISWSQ